MAGSRRSSAKAGDPWPVVSSTFEVKRTSLREGVSCFGPPKRGRARCGLIQEKLNGQESKSKQPRAEEAKAGEAEANGWAIGLRRSARAAGGTNAYEEEVRTGILLSRHLPTGAGDVAVSWAVDRLARDTTDLGGLGETTAGKRELR